MSDENRQIGKEFLSKPPGHFTEEIKKSYLEFEAVSQTFSFDTVPQKWAWQIKIEDKTEKQILLFISPIG